MRARVGGRWSELFGLGSISGDDDDTREHLRRRIGLYFFVLACVYTILYLVVVVLVAGSGHMEVLLRPERWIHLGVAGAALLAWLVTRWKGCTVGQLVAIDVVGTTAVAAGVGGFGLFVEPDWLLKTFDLLLVLTQTFFARAVIVPSTARRTLLVGLAGTVPLVAVMVVATFSLADAGGDMPPVLKLFEPVAWLSVTVLLTGLASRVIYGLRRQVRHFARLGQYTLGEKLGEGGMGVVYRASHAMLRRPAALKLLPPERAGARALARFEREVQLTATLTHPNTVAIYDFGRTPDGVFYYVMEYLDGMDLDALVRADGPQPPGRVVNILKQVAGALAEAHGAGLIHRDIKPANIVLTERGGTRDFATVLDFGLVRDVKGQDTAVSMANALVGTPLYLSPEAITAPDQVDGRSDCYALGAVGFYLLTGAPVFSGATLAEVCAHHLHTPARFPLDAVVPKQLETLVLACLEKLPEQRPRGAEELLISLETLDDVGPWTAADARLWWSRRPAATPIVDAQRSTLAVDVRERAGNDAS